MADVKPNKEKINFPFQEVQRDSLAFNRYQLAHNTSQIAILVANPTAFKVSIKSHPELVAKQAQQIKDEQLVKTKKDLLVEKTLDACRPREITGDSSKPCEILDVCRPHEMPEICRPREMPEMCRPREVKDTGRIREIGVRSPLLKHMNPEKDNTVFVDMTFQDMLEVTPTVKGKKCIRRGLNLTNEETEVFFQWQWDKLREKMDEEDSSPANMTMSTLDNSVLDFSGQSLSACLGCEALRLYQKAKRLCLDHIANMFLLLVGRRLLPLSKTQQYLALEVEELCQILSSDYLDVPNERFVFRAGYRWLRQEQDHRQQYVSQVLSWVRYGLMPMPDLIKCIFRSRHLLMTMLDVSCFPQALLKGFITLQLQELGLSSSMQEFESLPRFASQNASETTPMSPDPHDIMPVAEPHHDLCLPTKRRQETRVPSQYAACELVSTRINSLIRLNSNPKQ